MSIDLDFEPADLVAWRKLKRVELLNRGTAISPEEHGAKNASILTELTHFKEAFTAVIEFYSPFQGEVDV
jgi:hypothetical protein